jgi:hypothetical protein
MNNVARRWPFNAEARVQSQVSLCKICAGQSGSGTYFSPLSVPFHRCSKLIFIYMLLLPEGQTGEAWKPSFGNRGALDWKVQSYSHSVEVSVISRIMPQNVLKKCNNNNAVIKKVILYLCVCTSVSPRISSGLFRV